LEEERRIEKHMNKRCKREEKDWTWVVQR